MSRLWTMTLMMACLAVPLLAGDPAGDLKKMQGTWQGAILEIGGNPAKEEEKKIQVKLVVAGDKYTIFVEDTKISAGTMKLDESKKPKTIDAKASEGEFKDKVQLGIYQFEGEDFKVVFGEPGKDRPKEFKTRPKSEEVMVSYRRIKGK